MVHWLGLYSETQETSVQFLVPPQRSCLTLEISLSLLALAPICNRTFLPQGSVVKINTLQIEMLECYANAGHISTVDRRNLQDTRFFLFGSLSMHRPDSGLSLKAWSSLGYFILDVILGGFFDFNIS